MSEKEIISEAVETIHKIVSESGACGVRYAVSQAAKVKPDNVQTHLIEKVTATVTDSGEYTFRVKDNNYYTCR